MAGNVTESQMLSYLRKFHETYISSVERFLDGANRTQLARYSLLPTGIIGYVSTKSGAGYEYVEDPASEVLIIRGSAPVEELLFGAPARVRKTGPMLRLSNAVNCGLAGMTLDGSFPVRLEGLSSLRLEDVRAQAGSWVKRVKFAEMATDRTMAYWSDLNAVTRAKDEVLQAMVDLQLAASQSVSLGEYLEKFKERHVLLLGDFSAEGRERLTAISESLKRQGYIPVLLDEVPEFPEYDLRQKLNAVAAVVRFVVIDDSSKAGQLAEIPLIDFLRVTAVILRMEGSVSSFVVRPLAATSRVIREVAYNAETLETVLAESAAWAESTVDSAGKENKSAYPWRTR